MCPWHGMQFDILTGQSLPNKNVRLRTFPVRVVDGEIRVQVGGAECECRNLKDALRTVEAARINTVRMGKKTIGVSSEILVHTKRAQVQLLKQGGYNATDYRLSLNCRCELDRGPGRTRPCTGLSEPAD